MPAPYLRDTVTGYIFPYHEMLAAEPNFVSFEGPINPEQPKPRGGGTELLYRPASFAAAAAEAGVDMPPLMSSAPPTTAPAKRMGRPPKAKVKEHIKGADLEHTAMAPAIAATTIIALTSGDE